MTQRQRLRRQPGNDGKVRVLVPRDLLTQSRRASQDNAQEPSQRAQRDRASDAQDAMRTAIEALRGENVALRGQIEAKDALIAELQTARDQARAEAQELHQADRARRGLGRWSRLRAAWRG